MHYSALIGNPTDHSVSYILYRELAKVAGIQGFYQHIRVNIAKNELSESLHAFNTLHFVGLNVTLPYKLDVMNLIDEIDPVARELGAVNTIKLGSKVRGYNTDWAGITESIKQFSGEVKYSSAVIFGTGGASRAAIYACKELGIKDIHVVYRLKASDNTCKLQEHSSKLGIALHSYSEVKSLLEKSQLVINATSAGMVGKEALPFELASIYGVSVQDKVFLDAVFNPLHTPLLDYFERNGAITIDGLWMMIYQGVGALNVWFDRDIQVSPSDLSKIHNLMEEELKNV